MSNDKLENFTDAVAAIQEDEALKACFIKILKYGASHQQVRVKLLKEELQKQAAPEEILDFVSLLKDDKLAHQLLSVLTSGDMT